MTRRAPVLKYTTRCKLFAFLCVLPWLIGFVVFTLRPLIDTVMYSFSVTSFHASGAIELRPNGWAITWNRSVSSARAWWCTRC